MSQQPSTPLEPTKPILGGTISTETITLEVETTPKGVKYAILPKGKFQVFRESNERYMFLIK